jgi:hypothetical protein
MERTGRRKGGREGGREGGRGGNPVLTVQVLPVNEEVEHVVPLPAHLQGRREGGREGGKER